MKLDKIKFATLISYLTRHCEANLRSDDLAEIDDIIDVDVVTQKVVSCNPDRLNDLLELMKNGQKKIEAIKVYRDLTGEGLKESKDVIEAYWVTKLQEA